MVDNETSTFNIFTNERKKKKKKILGKKQQNPKIREIKRRQKRTINVATDGR